MTGHSRSKTSGNILIYILGAILLLGLLIVALKGSFQEGTGIDAEKALMSANDIQRYGAEMERGVSYILRNNFSETDIRFANPNAASSYGSIDDDPRRQVFSPQGGGVEWRAAPAIQTSPTPWSFCAQTAIAGVGSTCTDASCADLVAYLMFLPKELCLRINDAVGVSNPLGNPPVDSDGWTWGVPFLGTYSYAATLSTAGNETFGKQEACVEAGGTYHYYRVLLAR